KTPSKTWGFLKFELPIGTWVSGCLGVWSGRSHSLAASRTRTLSQVLQLIPFHQRLRHFARCRPAAGGVVGRDHGFQAFAWQRSFRGIHGQSLAEEAAWQGVLGGGPAFANVVELLGRHDP